MSDSQFTDFMNRLWDWIHQGDFTFSSALESFGVLHWVLLLLFVVVAGVLFMRGMSVNRLY